MADNFHFDITGAPLDECLRIALQGAPGGKVQGWGLDTEKNRLLLYWNTDEAGTPFPAPLDLDGVVEVVTTWLREVNYGPQPDHDGHNTRGWRVYNESWSRIGHDWGAFAAVEPSWLMHGK